MELSNLHGFVHKHIYEFMQIERIILNIRS